MVTWQSAEAAEIWRKGAERRARMVAQATAQMLEAARLKPGMRVLDLAAGTGEQSLLAAERVGPSGSVLATDISQSMLTVAEESARDAKLQNVETLAADASSIELPAEHFDAAICRFGLMFLPDVAAAVERVYRALKPGGRFATLVWSSEDRNPWIAVQVGIVREMGRIPSPAPSLVRTTALSKPGALESALTAAGFRDVDVTPVPTPRDFASVDEAFETMQSSSPARGELIRDLTDAERERYVAELKRRLGAFVQPNGRCFLPGEALLGSGSK